MPKKSTKPKSKPVAQLKPAKASKSAVKPQPVKAPKGRSALAPAEVKTEARALKTRIAESGKTSRIKGHVSATTRKNQAKKDAAKKDAAKKDIAKRDQRLVLSRSKENSKTLPLPTATRSSNMNIEVSTKGGCSAEFVADVSAIIDKGLSRYEQRITRIEAHFEDVNGPKGGVDHLCRLEARLAAMKPVKVSDSGTETVIALKGAIAKMDRLLKSTLGKMNVVKGKTSASGLPT